MKKLLPLLPLLFACAAVRAQVSNPDIIPVSVAPSGACSITLPIRLVTPGGTLYSCQNGTWGQVSGGGGGLFVMPESYGALGNAVYRFDGVTAAPTAIVASSGSSTTPTAPAVTTNLNNDVVLSIFQTNASWSASPATGTNRVNVPFAAGEFGAFVNDQTIATAGSVGTVSGTTSSSSGWESATLSLACATGGCSFINAQSAISASGASQTVNVPTGVTNGDTLIACNNWFQNAGSTNGVTAPAGWGVPVINLYVGANSPSLVCWQRKAHSEPANYTWTQAGSSGLTTFIMDYRNSLGVDGSVLTSATANFTSADVGKLLCVAGVANQFNVVAGGQMCGTITGYNSSTSVLTSVSASAQSALQFAYGSDDTTAFQNMLTSTTCTTIGCHVMLGMKQYAVSQTLTIPPHVPTIFEGAGSGQVNTENNYLNGSGFANSNGGSRLVVLTQAETTPAIFTSGPAGFAASDTAIDEIKNIAILGGAGKTRDGGGSDCINIINWQNFNIKNVSCGNFAGRGAYTDGFNGYIEEITFDQFYSYWNNSVGLQVGSGTSANFLETVGIYNSVIENNGSYGIRIANGGGYQGLTITSNIIQWNNINVANPEIEIDHAVSGCEIRGNYLEVDTNGGSKSNNPWNLTDRGCNFGQNFILGTNSAFGNTLHVDTVGTVHIGGAAPTASTGTLTGNNNGGQVTGLSAATTLTLTFANGGWASWNACHGGTSVSGTTVSVTSSSLTAVTLTFSSALTGTAYYHCDGN